MIMIAQMWYICAYGVSVGFVMPYHVFSLDAYGVSVGFVMPYHVVYLDAYGVSVGFVMRTMSFLSIQVAFSKAVFILYICHPA